MISQLRGRVAALERDAVVLDVGGIGFRVSVPAGTRASLGRVGEEVRLLTTMVIREGFVGLYGFETSEERGLFEMLRDVSGIGPKTALSILSTLPPDRLILAISSGDIRTLSTAPGVGKRTAERLAVELRGKVGELAPADAAPDSGADYGSGQVGDAISALVSLGYSPVEAERAVATAVAAGCSGEASVIIRAALSRLARTE
ncbi:MAG: Holliday junction branch migration protein RuvA [Clostridia bacterium]|nr:Holliday junction branch migration protein RuvA [Clostridia bacterium]